MSASFSSLSRTAGLAAILLAATTGAQAGPEGPTAPENNFITLTGAVNSLSGNEAAFQAGTQMSKKGANGIEELRYGSEPSKDSTLQFDGRLLTGVDDYLAKLRYTKEEVGSFEIGYKRFRTFYDGIGGFFANSGTWLPLNDEFLHVDRGTFWLAATIAKPNAPVFHLRYSNELRNGRKDSTIQGDTDNTGVPIWSIGSFNPISANRKINAAYLDLDERHQTLEASMTHSFGNTKIDLRVVSDKFDNVDSRFVSRYPGEIKPYPSISTTPPAKPVSWTQANNQIDMVDTQGVETDSLSILGKVETKISSGITMFGGLSYMSASSDISGSRLNTIFATTSTGVVSYLGGFSASSGQSTRPPYSYNALGGIVKTNALAANVGVDIRSIPDLQINAALKAEQLFIRGSNPVTYVSTKYDTITGATSSYPVDTSNTSRAKERVWVPELNLRYTGIKKVTLYADANYRFSPGDEKALNGNVTYSGGTIIASVGSADDRIVENHGSYKVGANWLASSHATFRAETFIKNHHNGFYDNVTAGDQFLVGYEQKGYSIAGTLKPVPGFSYTAKYLQYAANMWTTLDAASKFESMDSKVHQISQTIDWSPTRQFYLQASLNTVYDLMKTAYSRVNGIGRDVVEDADNDYLTASMVAGIAVDDETDVELSYTYYRADNYKPKYATVAYGADAKDYQYAICVKRRFSKEMVGSLKVGYIHYNNLATGGFTNYKGTVAYATLTHSF